MGTAYPTDFDNWTNVVASPPGTETLALAGGSRKHSQIHDDLQAAIIALEQTVGKTGAFAFDPTGAAASALASALAAFAAALASYVPTTRTVNGHALSADVTVAFANLSSIPSTLAGYGIASHVVLTDDDGANNWELNGTTTDGADNWGFALTAGGAGSASRGAYIGGRGNEYTAIAGQRGKVFIVAGNVDAPTGDEGCVVVYTGAEVKQVKIDPNGTVTLTGGAAIGGAMAFAGSASTTFVSPGGSSVPTKIGIALYDVGAFGQVLALGIDSTVATTARVILLCDGRTVQHQPTLNIISPDENQSAGVTWDGSNAQVRLVSSATLALTVGAVGSRVDVLIVGPTGALLPKGVSAPFGPSGNQNEAYGLGAGRSAATGGQNVGLGPGAIASLTNGNNNNAVGYGAGNAVTSGSDNNLMGNQAGRSISSGNYNSGQGSNALLNITTGQGNTAIGFDSILRLTTSSYNTGVGFQAGFTPTGSAGPMTLIGSCADNAGGYANVIVLVSGSAAAVNAYGANTCTIHAASGTAGDATTLILSGVSSTTNRKTGGVKTSFIVSTDASFTCRLALFAEDFGGDREGVRIDATGSGVNVGIGGAVNANALLNVNGDTLTRHVGGNGSTPGIAAGAGAGTSPTVTMSGNDVSGIVTVTTGTLPSLSAVVATITFAVAYNANAVVTLTPYNANAATLSGANMVFAVGATGTFTITSGTTALTPATTFQWQYQVSGN